MMEIPCQQRFALGSSDLNRVSLAMHKRPRNHFAHALLFGVNRFKYFRLPGYFS
jgi:hypothetical protein